MQPRSSLWVLLLAVACSKGEGGGTGTDPARCRSLAELEAPMGEMPLPKGLYTELRHDTSGLLLPVELDGMGGSYSGATRSFTRCDPAGNYFVERLALVDVKGNLVATARRSGSSWIVSYSRGGTVTSPSFGQYYATYSPPGSAGTLAVQSLSAGSNTVRQGERLTVTINTTLTGDECGLREAQLWLSTSPGSMSTTPAVIPGAAGSGSLRVPAELSPTTYFVEGRIWRKSDPANRYFMITRRLTTDTTYSLYNPQTGTYTPTGLMIASVSVTQNPMADRQAPQVVSMSASPASAERCQQVSLSLKIADDQGLPAMQEVRVRLVPQRQPALMTSVLLTGGDTFSGSFTVPMDAPGGVWYAYPEQIQDAAGNIGTGQLNIQMGTFTIQGAGSPGTQIMAATFLVPSNDPPPDLGMTPLDMGAADMRPVASYPATLNSIAVSPQAATADKPVTVSVNWQDNAGILK